MDWEAAGTIVALVGVLVTFVFNIRSNRLTRQELEQDRQLARDAMEQDRRLREAAAQRSEAAARLTEGYSRRVVDALERMAQGRGLAGAMRAPSHAGVRWTLRHDNEDRYRLTNVGDTAARELRLQTDETLPLGEVEGGPEVGPGEAVTFAAERRVDTRDSTVTVTWRAEEDPEPSTWQYPLPAQPT